MKLHFFAPSEFGSCTSLDKFVWSYFSDMFLFCTWSMFGDSLPNTGHHVLLFKLLPLFRNIGRLWCMQSKFCDLDHLFVGNNMYWLCEKWRHWIVTNFFLVMSLNLFWLCRIDSPRLVCCVPNTLFPLIPREWSIELWFIHKAKYFFTLPTIKFERELPFFFCYSLCCMVPVRFDRVDNSLLFILHHTSLSYDSCENLYWCIR